MAKTIDNRVKNSRMKRIFLFLIVALGTLSSQGQYSETQRRLFTGTLENLKKVEPLVDSLLSYPGNRVEWQGDSQLALNAVVVTQQRPLTYAIVSSLSVDDVNFDILLKMYESAIHYAEVPALRQKQLAEYMLNDLYSILTEKFKTLIERDDSKLENKESLKQTVDLAHKCQTAYYKYCFRYLVGFYPFYLNSHFADNELANLLRYNLNNPKRTEQEMSIAIQCRNDEMYYIKDTLHCGSLPDSRLCRDLKSLKRKSTIEKIPLDTLIEQHNREVMNDAVSAATRVTYLKTEQEDFCKRVLRLLDGCPIKGVEKEVEMYGKKYEQYGVDWMHILARLGYKDYVNRYVESVDYLLKRDEKMEDKSKRYQNVLRFQNNLFRLGHPEAIEKFAHLLLSNDMMQGDRKQTQLSYQIFLMLRFYIPELNSYGRTYFVPYCKKNYLGKHYNDSYGTEGVPIALKPIRNSKHLIISCDDIYKFGDELDYRYYPSNFFKLMYDWMEKNKGKYKVNSTKIYAPY